MSAEVPRSAAGAAAPAGSLEAGPGRSADAAQTAETAASHAGAAGVVAALAFDLGASSGRAVVGCYDAAAGRLTMAEIHRFDNTPVQVGGHLHWDILRLFHEVKEGLRKAGHWGKGGASGTSVSSVGIDSWAVDFGLLGPSGELLGNPYHYRDKQTDGAMEEVLAAAGRERIFDRTGLQFLPFNTLYQLHAIKRRAPWLLEQAQDLLMIPELLRYWLTGERFSEFTNASTTQLLNRTDGQWDRELLTALGLPERLFRPPVPAGTPAGRLAQALCEELDIAPLQVVAVGEHDTASAVAAVPAAQPDFAYLICGTWSLLGTELPAPVVNEQALAWNFTNEGGVFGTTRLLKNIMGLWLIQECRRVWAAEGRTHTFAGLAERAREAEAFRSLIDPDAADFLNPAHMPRAIAQYCERTGQPAPRTEGEFARCIFESLALKYRLVLERTELLAGRAFSGLHAVGGGVQNELLCGFTADAIGREVWAGPVEASALGNLAVQYISMGCMPDLAAARTIIRDSFPVRVYRPSGDAAWQGAYERWLRLVERWSESGG